VSRVPWPDGPADTEQESETPDEGVSAAEGLPAAEAAPADGNEDTDERAGAADGDEPAELPHGHAPGELEFPVGVTVLQAIPAAGGRGVGIVASRFNGDVTNRLIASAMEELDRLGVRRELVTVMSVPGAFELPLGAMALAKTRRYACIVALGCVIRGETAHFDYVAGEAASGLQLAGLETGVPVSFGLLTVDTLEQAFARAGKGAESVRAALEMADIFGQLRAHAKAAT